MTIVCTSDGKCTVDGASDYSWCWAVGYAVVGVCVFGSVATSAGDDVVLVAHACNKCCVR